MLSLNHSCLATQVHSDRSASAATGLIPSEQSIAPLNLRRIVHRVGHADWLIEGNEAYPFSAGHFDEYPYSQALLAAYSLQHNRYLANTNRYLWACERTGEIPRLPRERWYGIIF